jgi:hypothetical protein
VAGAGAARLVRCGRGRPARQPEGTPFPFCR